MSSTGISHDETRRMIQQCIYTALEGRGRVVFHVYFPPFFLFPVKVSTYVLFPVKVSVWLTRVRTDLTQKLYKTIAKKYFFFRVSSKFLKIKILLAKMQKRIIFVHDSKI